MVRYLKDRGVYVLFNTNGTVLSERNGRALIDAGLDELRVSLDASNRESFKAIRGRDYFNRIIRNVRAFRELQEREGHHQAAGFALADRPEGDGRGTAGLRESCGRDRRQARSICSGWCSSTKSAIGMARPDQALFESLTARRSGLSE